MPGTRHQGRGYGTWRRGPHRAAGCGACRPTGRSSGSCTSPGTTATTRHLLFLAPFSTKQMDGVSHLDEGDVAEVALLEVGLGDQRHLHLQQGGWSSPTLVVHQHQQYDQW